MPSLFLYKSDKATHRFFKITLALKVFLQTFETNISRGSDDQNTQKSLYVFAKECWLSKTKKNWLRKSPQYKNRHQKGPQQYDTPLKMNGQVCGAATGERLRSKSIEGGGSTECYTPSCNI
jgi:hypothetical protein